MDKAAYLVIDTRTGAVTSRHRTENAAINAGYHAHPSGEGFVVRYGRVNVGESVPAFDSDARIIR